MKYQKPEAIIYLDQPEGVYLASGSSPGCTVSIIRQSMRQQQGHYVAEVAWSHSLINHMVNEILITFEFNQVAKFYPTDSPWAKVTPDGTDSGTVITLSYSYNDGKINNGYADFGFTSKDGLQLLNVTATER